MYAVLIFGHGFFGVGKTIEEAKKNAVDWLGGQTAELREAKLWNLSTQRAELCVCKISERLAKKLKDNTPTFADVYVDIDGVFNTIQDGIGNDIS